MKTIFKKFIGQDDLISVKKKVISDFTMRTIFEILKKISYRKIACVAAMVVSSQFKTTSPYL